MPTITYNRLHGADMIVVGTHSRKGLAAFSRKLCRDPAPPFERSRPRHRPSRGILEDSKDLLPDGFRKTHGFAFQQSLGTGQNSRSEHHALSRRSPPRRADHPVGCLSFQRSIYDLAGVCNGQRAKTPKIRRSFRSDRKEAGRSSLRSIRLSTWKCFTIDHRTCAERKGQHHRHGCRKRTDRHDAHRKRYPSSRPLRPLPGMGCQT